MCRTSRKLLLVGAVVAVLLAGSASQADAWWGHYGPAYWGCGYSPCYSPCYSVSYDPCCSTTYGGWYLGVRPGPIRRALLGPYRWYYGGYGPWATYSYDVCCADTVTTVSSSSTADVPTRAAKPEVEAPKEADEPAVYEPSPDPATRDLPGALPGLSPEPGFSTEPTIPSIQGFTPESGISPEPMIPSTPEPGISPERAFPPMPGLTPPPGISPEASTVPTRENSGLLIVWVPYEAKVTVNGLPTRSKGSRRTFVSYGLKPGFSYKYVVRAEIVRDGQVVEDVRTVILAAGDRQALAFGFNPEPFEEFAAN